MQTAPNIVHGDWKTYQHEAERVRAMVFIADMPAGVAAPPSPSMLADKFRLISLSASSSPGAKRNRRESGFSIARANASAAPHARRTPSSPPKNAYAPARFSSSATASPPPESSAR